MAAENRRSLRVEKELQQIVAKYLTRGLSQKLPGLVTVSRVHAGDKIRTAKIFVSVFGSDEDRAQVMEILEDNIYDIQKHVNGQLHMKYIPRISFAEDHGFEHMVKIEGLLHKISQEKQPKKPIKKNQDEEE